MAVGGDLGMTKNGEILTSYLDAYAPDVILLGGDTVYDDGMRNCYYSWDNFYHMFEALFDRIGRIIPIVFTVGNHDVGFNALADVVVDRSMANTPLFFVYNPQQAAKNIS